MKFGHFFQEIVGNLLGHFGTIDFGLFLDNSLDFDFHMGNINDLQLCTRFYYRKDQKISIQFYQTSLNFQFSRFKKSS